MDTPDSLASATAGMRVATTELDVIARNLANTSTTGFHPVTEAVSGFGDSLIALSCSKQAQGTLRHTGVATDLALDGPGFFSVATAGGVGYTRDGRLTADPHGRLCTQAGDPVLGSLGPVRFPFGARVLADGSILADGKVIDRLRVVTFDAPCESLDASLFSAPAGLVPQRSPARVRSGYLEDSGVDAVSQMTALISVERAFEANQKSMQQTDESLRRVVTEVPTVRS